MFKKKEKQKIESIISSIERSKPTIEEGGEIVSAEVEDRLSQEHAVLARVGCSNLECEGIRFYYAGKISVGTVPCCHLSFDFNGNSFVKNDMMPFCNVCGDDSPLLIEAVTYIKGYEGEVI